MKLPVFRLEEFFAQYEFTAPYLFCCSDAQSLTQKELLNLADTESLALWENLSLGYTEVPGLPLLRAELAQMYQLKAEEITTFAGAEDAIYCTFNALIESGDHVITYAPCYQSLEDLPRGLGARVTQLALKEENGWLPDLNELEEALRPDTKLIVINFPHNPSGATLDEEMLIALVELARKYGCYIFSDEVYRLLGPSTTTWSSPIASLYEKGISLGVMSKAYGLAGLRVGWIACQDQALIKQCQRYRYYTSICSSAPSEVLSLMALRAQDQILKRNCEIVDRNLVLLDEFLNEYQDMFSWVRPNGGCVGFVRYHADHPVAALADELVESVGVLIMPAAIYNFTGNYFRVGFGRLNMQQSLERFISHISKMGIN